MTPPDLYFTLMDLPPLERARAAAKTMDEYRAAIGMLAGVRRKALRQLIDEGASVADLAARLQVTRQQVHRLVKGEDARPRYLVEPGPHGTWMVTDLARHGGSKYETRERAVEVAQQWARRSKRRDGFKAV